MRRWGFIITAFYAIVLLAVLFPGTEVLRGESWRKAYTDLYRNEGIPWLWAAMLVSGQALLFLRVDRSWRKLRPRARVVATATAMGGATALLFLGIVLSILAAMYGDGDWPVDLDDVLTSNYTATVLVLWAFWTGVFAIYYRRSPADIPNAIDWMVKGSILELLVAVPAHVIVRRRNDCSAPGVTAFGIVTGTAIMLMCFGPAALVLFERWRQRYRGPSPRLHAHT